MAEISAFLQPINAESFLEDFDPDELNANGIYPAGAWNYKTDERYALNRRDIPNDFSALKRIFLAAKQADDCILCFAG